MGAFAGWQYLSGGETAPAAQSAPPAASETASEPTGAAPSNALAPNAVVLAVIDGDTMDVDLGGRRATVRFLGIDTPEKTGGYLPAECGGDAATQRTAELLPPGTEVLLQRDDELYDRYDRVLAYVYRAADGLFVNRYLVLDGYAATMHFEPNTHHRAVLDAAQADARAVGRGIWSDCGGPDRRLTDSAGG
ncbi:MAG: thermonuclease family protein [Acidimicrobiales bacterium]|nr:thermonuclease family protein [Acidimicrobiales bacterium]MYA82225.1 thermonuclease family protein [Acidimicrobiales bacterium]MYB81354.1 thermonuclease family protein [Acidimicrobiales bacterium]MYH75374.1 thermonuclease family protein [Acidimicrobiales bacterium]MYI12448.1 thermonuclease family protein [Acidimicrobiales bacterium]